MLAITSDGGMSDFIFLYVAVSPRCTAAALWYQSLVITARPRPLSVGLMMISARFDWSEVIAAVWALVRLHATYGGGNASRCAMWIDAVLNARSSLVDIAFGLKAELRISSLRACSIEMEMLSVPTDLLAVDDI